MEGELDSSARRSTGAKGPDIFVIMNAGSGKRRGADLSEELEAKFAHYPGRFALRVVQPGGQIAAEVASAVADGARIIVAAGGDGTICGVASQVVGTDCTMGVLPLGTFNYFAHSLDLPMDLDEAISALIEGETRPLRVGEVNGKTFLNNASLGAYPAILEQREDVYRRWGRSRIAAYWSVLVTLVTFRRPMALRVTVDGETRDVRTPLAFVANNAYQLDQLDLEGSDCVRAGKFALFIPPHKGRLTLLANAVRLATHSMAAQRDFELVCGKEIVIEAAKRHRLVARDGERERIEGPFRFRIRENALRVMVPAGKA